ncbi:MAG: hypothetical protein AAF543_16445 [Pseudomonadota bacterium]
MPAAKSRSKRDTDRDLLVLAFEIIADTGWQGFSFTELADRADISISDVRQAFASRPALLDALSRRLDQAMLSVDSEDLEELPPRDRVFEMVMNRLEAMAPFRAGLCRMMMDARTDPGLVIMTACRLDRSIGWLQDGAGLTHGHGGRPFGGLRRKIQRRLLGAVYLQTLNVWSTDESSDLAKTMASLDKQLRRIENLAGLGQGDNTESGAGAA